ncbi:MAG TPA: aminoacyl-tRNA hydrolase [Solirubrobacteraceae bacterium]|nr:aminoacyl-tRNA hydrolase [Solirubrobacteraceae bacterium]
MPLPGRRSGAPVDWLIVGLGNPGSEYAGTPHNVGFEVAERLIDRWQLGKPKQRYRGLLAEGRTGVGPGHARVAVLMPHTYMNEAGRSVGPARGELRVDLDHVLVIHDDIDLPFGEIRVRLGGGLAGHNGLKSLKAGLGGIDFRRVRIGVGRPPTTDPDRVAAYVLGKFRQPRAEVEALVDDAADAAERVLREAAEGPQSAGERFLD